VSAIRCNGSKPLPLQYIHCNFKPVFSSVHVSLGYQGLYCVLYIKIICVKSQHWWCASHLTLFHATPRLSYSKSFWYRAHKCTGWHKKQALLKCVVAAMCSWQHCGTGTLSYRPRHSVIMDQWNGQQCAFTIKMFYKNNDSLEGAQKEFRFFQFRASWSGSLRNTW